jgi:hypothetical protein
MRSAHVDAKEISPETIETVRKLMLEKAICQQTNMSYYHNQLVHCTLLATHVIDGTDHWGVEWDGSERGWDL